MLHDRYSLGRCSHNHRLSIVLRSVKIIFKIVVIIIVNTVVKIVAKIVEKKKLIDIL